MLPLLLAAAIATALPGRAYPVSNFDSVTLDAPASVTIAATPGFAVRASGDPALVARLTATVQGHTLVLALAKGPHLEARRGLRIAIGLPRLAGVTIAGAGNIVADRGQGAIFDATVGGAGNVTIRAIDAERTNIVTSGAGGVTVAGRTGELVARVSGVGSIHAARLVAKSGDLTVSGTGSIGAWIDGPAKVSLSGVGSVDVAGHPRCEVHRGGIGSVRCGDRS